jgi:cytochrome P450
MSLTSSKASPMTDDWYRDHYDHMSPQVADNFVEALDQLRSLCPVTHSDQYGGFWVVTKYDDVLHVNQDWATFSSAHGLTVPVAPIAVRNLPVEVDPPIQRVYKKLISPYFTPAAVLPWEPKTCDLAAGLVDQFIEAGRCEFMKDFGRIFPALSFFDFALNAPPEDIDQVAYMATKATIPNDPEAAECWMGLAQWITDFVETRRKLPRRGDVVDGILEAEIEGRPITDDEIVGLIQLLILGGLETTAGGLGMAMIRMCRQPEIPAELRRHPELIPNAVEEFLRLDPPFVGIFRTATHDTEIAGHPVKEGEKVVIYWASANRDEAEFSDPETFIVDRRNNRHLSFGAGPHRCSGSNLARMNIRVAFAEILRRLDDLQLQEGAEIHYHTTVNRAPLTVPITFTPGPRVGSATA